MQISLKAGHHRPPAKRHADDGTTLNAGYVALWLSGDPDQHC